MGTRASESKRTTQRAIRVASLTDVERERLESATYQGTPTTSATQRERSFAQELLCPWQDLEEFLAGAETDDDAISEAAAHFLVSEQVIRTTLVNKRFLARDQLM